MSGNEIRKRVQEQFGDKADAYTASDVHASPASLQQLVIALEPRPLWRALDVATGAGHTAHALAPHVGEIVASDVTVPMARQASLLAAEKGLTNVQAAAVDAEMMPFADQSFDLVTCRLAAHHFGDVDLFLREAWRVLRSSGILAVVDNFVPGSDRRGKKARLQQQAGKYVNAFERLRDPSHQRCLSVSEWRASFYTAGFAVEHEEIARKGFEMREWARRAGVPAGDLLRLRALLTQAPREVLEFLTPVFHADTIEFYLSELLIIGKKRAEKPAMG